MPPVIANGGYYGAPGVTAAGAYGSTPADMLHSLRNNGWSDQQIMNVYGANDPMVRIMQLENRWNQTQPGAGGYRYQYPTRATTLARRPTAQAQAQQRAAGPSMNTMASVARGVASMVPSAQPTRQPAAQQPAAQQPAAQQPAAQQPVRMNTQQTAQFEQALGAPAQQLPSFGSFSPMYTGSDALFANSGRNPVYETRQLPGLGDWLASGSASVRGLLDRGLGAGGDFMDYATKAVPNYFSGLYDTMRRAYYGLF